MLNRKNLKQKVGYDPLTGVLYWIEHGGGGARRGQEVGWAPKRLRKGRPAYRKLYFEGEKAYVHDVIWLYVTGDLPAFSIEHADGNTLNNRFTNLRLQQQRQSSTRERSIAQDNSLV